MWFQSLMIVFGIIVSVAAILMSYRSYGLAQQAISNPSAIKEYQTGVYNLNCWPVDKTKDACMDINNPPAQGSWRTFTTDIKFKQPFSSLPIIKFSSISHDVESGNRFNIHASNVKTDGFTLGITTWSNTSIYGMNVQWTALVLNQ